MELNLGPRRWFVMKQGKIFWFKSDVVTPDSVPRGVIDVSVARAEGVPRKRGVWALNATLILQPRSSSRPQTLTGDT
jgi:hypothetical protein